MLCNPVFTDSAAASAAADGDGLADAVMFNSPRYPGFCFDACGIPETRMVSVCRQDLTNLPTDAELDERLHR